MRLPVFLLLTSLCAPMAAQGPTLTHTLMPIPSAVRLAPMQLRIDTSFTVTTAQFRDGRLERAIARTVARLQMRIGVPLSRTVGTGNTGTLVVQVSGPGYSVPNLAEDESYLLHVTGSQVTLSANTVVGALRGLETMLQLQGADAHGIYLQGADIRDTPRFRWRGLLLDVSRHFEPVTMVEQTLDGMAMVKLNVLHWHLSDDQGFRVESMVFPRLQQLGSDSMYYTQAEIRHVVAYAADRGIRVMPEFDVPGHSSAWFVGYPDLTTGAGPFNIARTWGTFVPTMDPTRESTYQFLDQFIGEIATLFPDAYWHVGGDEVDPKNWQTTPAIQDYMKSHGIANEVALHTAFNKRLFAIVQQHGKIPVGWDEIFQPDLPTSAVIQSWRSTAALATSAKAGFHGILSAPYYIDHMKGAADFYLADPIPANTTLTAAEQALVLGGEACMWGEYTSSNTIASRLWPRLAAVAERFWSPAGVNDVSDMYRRLDVTSHRLSELGLQHEDHVGRFAAILGGDSAAFFTSLLGYVRPQDFGGNGANQFYPHTRLIDAAIPDPRATWTMSDRARAALAGSADAVQSLRNDFALMTNFPARAAQLQVMLPAAADAVPVASALADLAQVGSSALDHVGRRAAPDSAWIRNADSTLLRIGGKNGRSTSYNGVRPTPTEAVRILIEAAKALPRAAGTP